MAENFIDDGRLPDEQPGVVWDLGRTNLAQSAIRAMAVEDHEANFGVPDYKLPHPTDGVDDPSMHTSALWVELAIAMGPDGAKTLINSFRAINAVLSAPDFPDRLLAAKESLQG